MHVRPAGARGQGRSLLPPYRHRTVREWLASQGKLRRVFELIQQHGALDFVHSGEQEGVGKTWGCLCMLVVH